MPTAPVAARVVKAESAAEKKLTKLADLANRTGRALYERARIASELIADTEWVDSCGDEAAAYDLLTEKYFWDVFGLISVENLVAVFRALPEERWVEHRWSLRRLEIAWKEMNVTRTGDDKPEPGDSGRPTRKLVDTLTEEKERLAKVVKNRDEQLAVVTDENTSLRNRVRQLEMENATLKGRIEQLEKAMAARG